MTKPQGSRTVGEDIGQMSQNGKMSDDPRDGRRAPEGPATSGAGPETDAFKAEEQGAERLAELGRQGSRQD